MTEKFLSPNSRPEYMREADLYDKILPEFPYAPATFQAISQLIQSITESKGSARVLEYGFGTGLLTEQIATIGPNVTIVGVDPSTDLYPKAEERLAKMPNVRLIQQDATTFKSDEQFDVATATFAYHHLPDHLKPLFIQSAAANLVHGGKLIIGDEFLPSYHDLETKTLAIKDFYANTTQYLIASGASKDTIKAFADSLSSTLAGIEEFKVSLEVLVQELQTAGLQITEQSNIWPQEESDYGCKLITAIK